MKHDTFEMSGRINGKGKPYIYQYEKFEDWCNEWKGERIVMTVEVIDKKSEKQVVYYRKFILPQLKKVMAESGQFLNDEQLQEIIDAECPFMKCDDGEIMKVEDMNQSRLNAVIEWVKFYMAESMGHYIND